MSVLRFLPVPEEYDSDEESRAPRLFRSDVRLYPEEVRRYAARARVFGADVGVVRAGHTFNHVPDLGPGDELLFKTREGWTYVLRAEGGEPVANLPSLLSAAGVRAGLDLRVRVRETKEGGVNLSATSEGRDVKLILRRGEREQKGRSVYLSGRVLPLSAEEEAGPGSIITSDARSAALLGVERNSLTDSRERPFVRVPEREFLPGVSLSTEDGRLSEAARLRDEDGLCADFGRVELGPPTHSLSLDAGGVSLQLRFHLPLPPRAVVVLDLNEV